MVKNEYFENFEIELTFWQRLKMLFSRNVCIHVEGDRRYDLIRIRSGKYIIFREKYFDPL